MNAEGIICVGEDQDGWVRKIMVRNDKPYYKYNVLCRPISGKWLSQTMQGCGQREDSQGIERDVSCRSDG